MIPSLESLDAFCGWIGEYARSRVSPDQALAELGLDDLAMFHIVVSLEVACGEEFPDELVEAIETPRDLYDFAVVKSEHSHEVRGLLRRTRD